MAWANFSVFAFGSLLMGIPILLHLLMKQRPKHQVFPALRFLHRRQVANKRQLRLRNWLLLALRLAAIGLLAALVARPSVDSAGLGAWLRAILLGVLAPLAVAACAYSWVQSRGRLLIGATGLLSLVLCGAFAFYVFQAVSLGEDSHLGDADTPVAAVLVIDTSPRMGLRHQNLTRLEEARRAARDLIKQLPPDSEVAIVDAASRGVFSVDMGSAVNLLDSLQVTGSEYPLAELVLRGIELVRERDDLRKEVYVFSELSQQVWQADAFNAVRRGLAQRDDISLFVLDVGVQEPRNVGLGQLRLSSDSVVQGQPLRIDTEIHSLNLEGQFDVEVLVEKPDSTRPVIIDGELLLPELTQRDRSSPSLAANASVAVSFQLRLPAGIQHGQVQVRSNDGLSIDDRRYFTVEVRPPYPVLLAVSSGADPEPVKQAISPDEYARRGEAVFDCHVVDAQDLLTQELPDYSVIAMLDPLPLTSAHWTALHEYVVNGGSLVVFLGRNAQPPGIGVSNFNAAAAALMPGKLKAHWRTGNDDFLFISPRTTSHPILELFRGRESITAWDESPIFRHWVFDELRPGTNVVTRYSNNQPALLESVVGKGRVVVMTTPVSDRRNDPQRPAWNQLPTTDVPLPFWMLMNGLFPYLAGQSQAVWNHDVNQVVTIATPAVVDAVVNETWQLVTPQGDWQNVRSDQGSVTIATTNAPGVYRLKPPVPDRPALGFSANLPDKATDLRRIEPDAFDEILGKDRYTLARGTDELNRGIGRARIGRELFPFLAVVVVGLLAMEHLLSNRFYSAKSQKNKQETKLPAAA